MEGLKDMLCRVPDLGFLGLVLKALELEGLGVSRFEVRKLRRVWGFQDLEVRVMTWAPNNLPFQGLI